MNMNKKIALFFFIAFFFMLILLSSKDNLNPIFVFAQGIQGLEYLWKIDDGKRYSSEGFDICPMDEPNSSLDYFEYIMLDQEPEDVSDFPGGLAGTLADDEGCLPAKIYLRFFLDNNYAKTNLLMAMHGCGEFMLQFDSCPPQEIRINTGFGWETEEVPGLYIFAGEHEIILETKNNAAYAYFDYLKFTGFRDTDQDGICDNDEGELDSDGDGLADWLDADCTMIPLPSGPQEKILFMIQSQEEQRPRWQEVSITDINLSQDPNSGDGLTGIQFIYGLIFGRLCNLETGGEVRVTFAPPRQIYGIEQVWARDNLQQSWVLLSAVIDKTMNQVHFTLKDGGFADMDKTDGRISLCFGLGIPRRLSSDSLDSCFLGLVGSWSKKNE